MARWGGLSTANERSRRPRRRKSQLGNKFRGLRDVSLKWKEAHVLEFLWVWKTDQKICLVQEWDGNVATCWYSEWPDEEPVGSIQCLSLIWNDMSRSLWWELQWSQLSAWQWQCVCVVTSPYLFVLHSHISNKDSNQHLLFPFILLFFVCQTCLVFNYFSK